MGSDAVHRKKNSLSGLQNQNSYYVCIERNPVNAFKQTRVNINESRKELVVTHVLFVATTKCVKAISFLPVISVKLDAKA